MPENVCVMTLLSNWLVLYIDAYSFFTEQKARYYGLGNYFKDDSFARSQTRENCASDFFEQ